jgi:hypothetical protein
VPALLGGDGNCMQGCSCAELDDKHDAHVDDEQKWVGQQQPVA